MCGGCCGSQMENDDVDGGDDSDDGEKETEKYSQKSRTSRHIVSDGNILEQKRQ